MAKVRTKKNSRPHWQKLSWHAPRRCWKKYREGRTYYLEDSGVNKSDRQAHDKALRKWEQILAKQEDRTEERIARLGYDPPPNEHA